MDSGTTVKGEGDEMARIRPKGLNVQEAAKYIGVSANTLRKYVRDGLLRGVATGRKGMRFHQDSLDEFLKGKPAA
jgi:excisionase family DNA binding protein